MTCTGVTPDGLVHEFRVGQELVGFRFRALKLKLTVPEYLDSHVQEWIRCVAMCRLTPGTPLEIEVG